MFCQKCGKEILDEAVICVHCGCATGNQTPNNANTVTTSTPTISESSGLANSAILFAFLIPIVGLICGIIGTVKYKNPTYHNRSKGAIFISVGVWILSMAIMLGSGLF